MSRRIQQDEHEFLDIVRRKLRKDLLSFLRQGKIIFPTGGGKGIIVPLPEIHIPRFSFAPPPKDVEDSERGEDEPSGTGPDIGIGQDTGKKPGDILGPVEDDGEGEGQGEGKDKGAGRGRGGDTINIELSEEEFMEFLAEILELPRIKPKGSKLIVSEEKRYTDIRTVGPESLLHKRRTIKEAMKRQISEGTYDPNDPVLIPVRGDKRYRIPRIVTKPKNNALVVYMMDVSGSMGEEERRVVRFTCSLISFWLRANYDGLAEEWIVHDDGADRVSREDFFRTHRGGGTTISSAHEKLLQIIDEEYPAPEWNIYPVYFSDGFNWGGDDDICLKLLSEKILPIVNQYSYGEVSVERPWWPAPDTTSGVVGFSPSGSYGLMLLDNFSEEELVATASLHTMDEVPEAIKVFFGKGR